MKYPFSLSPDECLIRDADGKAVCTTSVTALTGAVETFKATYDRAEIVAEALQRHFAPQPTIPTITHPLEIDALKRMKEKAYEIGGLIEDGMPACEWATDISVKASEIVRLIDAALLPGE